jgi:diguanylate cyclase (GGDEF)-like protein
LRTYDRVFRYGGEEFLIVLPGTSLGEGFDIIERLREELARLSLDVGAQEPIKVTASFGVTPLDTDVSVENAIERADQALYRAKAEGRNRSVIWSPTMAENGASLKDKAA